MSVPVHLTISQDYHQAWCGTEHADLLDRGRFTPRFILCTLYECFNEIRLLNEVLNARPSATVLEVGCATGELYRYLRTCWPQVRYVGADISQPALERARMKYPQGTFTRTGEDLQEVRDVRADVVFCRDVVHHQPDPFAFLGTLYNLTGRALVLRLRTRDYGPTERDPERSCQYIYGSWVPFIVLNCGEVISALQRPVPAPARVKLLKHYMVLGGQNLRFLPKDCYDLATGTAETAVLVEKGTGTAPTQVVELASPDGVSGLGVQARKPLGRIVGRLIRLIVGKEYRGPIRW